MTQTLFTYDPQSCADLSGAMSVERFQRYLDVASGDVRKACQLYTWNTAVSAAFYGPLQTFEVVLRNAVHERLSGSSGVQWFTSGTLLRRPEADMVVDAQQRLVERHKALTPGRVVAELSLGFWVGLFTRAYDQDLWRTHVSYLFSPRPPRADLHDNLERLRTLRNRIAHHEPVFQRDLKADYARLEHVVSDLSPTSSVLLAAYSRVPVALSTMPDLISAF